MSPYLLLGVGLLALVQVMVLIGLGSAHYIGDERDYLKRAQSEDPHRPGIYLRVPLFVSLLCLLQRCKSSPRQMQAVNGLIGLLAVLLTVLAAEAIAASSLVVLLVHAALLEYQILSSRLWPESLLALWHSCILLVLVGIPDPLVACALIGAVGALAALTRFEQVLLAPAAGLALALSDAGPGLVGWLLIVAPTVLAWAGWALRNWRAYGMPWPDTTWRFNLALMAREGHVSGTGPARVQRIIEAELPRWHADRVPKLAAEGGLRPGKLFADVLLRWLAFLGKDSFIRQRLLPPVGRGYWAPRFLAPIRGMLAGGFPLLVCISVAAAVSADYWPHYLIPAAALFVASASFHARTRYRIVLVPALALWLGGAVARLDWRALADHYWVWAIAALCAVALAVISFREEE